MDKRTVNEIPNWISSDALADFIDRLRDAGYKIGVSQYIAAQELILALVDQDELLDSPERLCTLLGPIFCSSPTEQHDFQQQFTSWIELLKSTHQLPLTVDSSSEKVSSADEEAQALSDKLENIRIRSHWLIKSLVSATFVISVISILAIFWEWENSQIPRLKVTDFHTLKTLLTKQSFLTAQQSPTETVSSTTEKSPIAKALPNNTLKEEDDHQQSPNLSAICLFALINALTFFLIWQLWWYKSANQFLQRLGSRKEPELQKFSIQELEPNLFSPILFSQIVKGLRYRIRIPSYELDMKKTIDATLQNEGWLLPVYESLQLPLEYLFLIDRVSIRDHQSKFIEGMIDVLKQDGVFITRYFFESSPNICFSENIETPPKKLNEVIHQYHHHCVIVVADIDRFFNAINGELEFWVGQLKSWSKCAILTPNPVKNWTYQEIMLSQQFIVLPATSQGLLILSQVLNPDVVESLVFSEENKASLPNVFLSDPIRWIERDPPDSEQVEAMLKSTEQYLGKTGYYWFSACAIFPEIHWNITIYLGTQLQTEEGISLLDECSPSTLVRLPWFRYGYMPDWLRMRIILTLTDQQESAIRSALQNLLLTSMQGSVTNQALGVAKNNNFLPKLINPILHLTIWRAAKNSPLREYLFLRFMKGQAPLASRVPDEFRYLRKRKILAYSLNQLKLTLNQRFLVIAIVLIGISFIVGLLNLLKPVLTSSFGNRSLLKIEGNNSREFLKLKTDGILAMSQKNYPVAAQNFQAALANNPNAPETRIYLNNAMIGNEASQTIAVSVPITEEENNYRALEMLRGFAHAQQNLNKGRNTKIKIEIFNDEEKPEKAEAIANELVGRSNILGVVGHSSSPVSLASAEIYNSRQMPFITPISISTNLTGKDKPYIFRTNVRSEFVAQALANYMLRTNKKYKAVIFYVKNSAYSEDLQSRFAQKLVSDGGEVVGSADFANPNATRDLAQAMAKGAEVIVLFPTYKHRQRAWNVLRDKQDKYPKTMVFGDIATLYSFETLNEARSAAEGMILGVSWNPNTRNTIFQQESNNLWRSSVNWATATSYEAFQAMGTAIQSDSLTSRNGVRDNLSQMKFDGVDGTFQFFNGDSTDRVTLVRVEKSGANRKYSSGTGYDYVPVIMTPAVDAPMF
jgi:ABC-type branched-subunit amino acid transport system substrate-binding protein